MGAARSTPAPDGFLAELRRNVLEHPSFLTEELFDTAPDRDAVRGLRDTWAAQERMLVQAESHYTLSRQMTVLELGGHSRWRQGQTKRASRGRPATSRQVTAATA